MSVAELPPSTGSVELPVACTNCGETGVRNYCPACGETRPGHADMSLGHFIGHAFHELVHLDSKIFKSFLYLITRPGFLTAEYFDGRKKRYITPVRIYITLFALSLFAYSVRSSVSVWDFQKFLEADATGRGTAAIERLVAGSGTTSAAFVERVNSQWHKLITLTQFVNIAMLALALQLLYWRSRRYFVEHMVFSLHLQSAFLLLALLAWPLWWATSVEFTQPGNYGFALCMMVLHAVITVLAVRRFYRQDTLRTVAKGLAAYLASYAASVVLTLATLAGAFYLAVKSVKG